VVIGRETAFRECALTVFIDGIKEQDQSELPYLHPDEMAAVEIYPRGLLVPVEFQTPRSTCGVIAIWTKRVTVIRR
jgi:hypothetical protein